MSALLQDLQAEADRREAAFVAKLQKAGFEAFAAEYNDIITIRNAVEVMSKKTRSVRNQRSSAVASSNGDGDLDRWGSSPAPEGFVLSDAIRDIMRATKPEERVRASTIFMFLQEKYPDYITEEKKPSISATLSNLVGYGELTREIDGQRKVWYRVGKLRDETDATRTMT